MVERYSFLNPNETEDFEWLFPPAASIGLPPYGYVAKKGPRGDRFVKAAFPEDALRLKHTRR